MFNHIVGVWEGSGGGRRGWVCGRGMGVVGGGGCVCYRLSNIDKHNIHLHVT